MSAWSLGFGWFGLIFMIIFSSVLIGLLVMERKGEIRIKKRYIYGVMAGLCVIGVSYLFSKTINIFFF